MSHKYLNICVIKLKKIPFEIMEIEIMDQQH